MGATAEMDTVGFSLAEEKPVHKVYVESFAIGVFEVTQELWQAVMGTNPSSTKSAYCPVESVSWNDCQEFIQKLNAITGKQFRLPTEAEWEYAARGGNRSHNYLYSGSDDINAVADPVLDAVVFDMTNAITKRDYGHASELLGQLLKKQEEPFVILAVISKELRRIYTARIALDNGKDKLWLMELWGMRSDYPARLLMEAARKTTSEWCSHCLLYTSPSPRDTR